MGFPLVVIAVLAAVAAGFGAGVTQSAAAALLLLTGILNPLIAWLIIRGIWNYKLSEESLLQKQEEILPAKEPVKLIFKISAIINTLLGLALFVGGLGTIIGVGYIQPGSFWGSVLLDGCVSALGITALAQCFGKRVASLKWLQILQLVVACGAVVILLIIIIAALTY